MFPGKAQERQQRKWARQRRKLTKGMRRLDVPRTFMDHPRYGDQPIVSGEGWSEAEVRRAHWSYARVNWDEKVLFPETAIRANPCRQRTDYGWRTLYVDIARRCRTCGQWFLFFALEQKFWFEELGFFIDADCVHCQHCRHAAHDEQRLKDRYAALLNQPEKTLREWRELESLGDHLFAAGHITKPETLLRSRMPKRLRRTIAG